MLTDDTITVFAKFLNINHLHKVLPVETPGGQITTR